MADPAANPADATSPPEPLPAWKRRVFVAATMGAIALSLIAEALG